MIDPRAGGERRQQRERVPQQAGSGVAGAARARVIHDGRAGAAAGAGVVHHRRAAAAARGRRAA